MQLERNHNMKKLLISTFLLLLTTLTTYSSEQWTGLTKPVITENKYFLHSGFVFDAVLKTAIFSFNTITPVIAQTEYDITFNDKVVIPKYTKIIGDCSIVKTIDRVNIILHTMVFPDGQEIKFNGMVLHTDGSGGIPGKVKKQRAKLPAQILLNAAAQTADIATGGNVASELIRGLSQETSAEISEKQDYSIEVPKDTAIQVYVIDRIEY